MTEIPKQISLFPILLVNFIGTLGFSIVLPFLVFLVTDFGGNALVFGISVIGRKDTVQINKSDLKKFPWQIKKLRLSLVVQVE